MSSKIDYSEIAYGGMRFIVTGTPDDDTLADYVALWQSLGVVRIVRMCETTLYDASKLPATLPITELLSQDGDVPADADIDAWLALVAAQYGSPAELKRKLKAGEIDEKTRQPAIAVHCVAGLGRSPLVVAVALMEYGCEGGKAPKVIEYVRARRRKALNMTQMKFLREYKPRLSKDCVIM